MDSAVRNVAGSFPPSRVFWLFLSQVFLAGGTCREAVRKFLCHLALEGGAASPRTAAYCKARQRLRQADLDGVHHGLVKRVRAEHGQRGLWRGRCVKVVDGSGLSMPDTPANQRLYPQPRGAKPGCSFPVMRVAALFDLATGLLLDLAKGSLRVGERILFRELWPLLEKGDVVLADRGLCGFAEFYLLQQRGVDSVMRAHQRRTVGKSRLQRLGRGDWLVAWRKSKPGPKSPDKAVASSFPHEMIVREIAFNVPIPGFRTRAVTVATTLLDADAFPTHAFRDLYRRRWQAELYLRDIKITMGMDVLRCKSPAMVHKELTMRMIAYNLVRLTMVEAAREEATPASAISFKGALDTLRQWAPFFAVAPAQPRANLWRHLLAVLVRDPLPLRPNRTEPRARKRRPKNYQLLNQPRHVFKEILHRNKYVKALS